MDKCKNLNWKKINTEIRSAFSHWCFFHSRLMEGELMEPSVSMLVSLARLREKRLARGAARMDFPFV